MAEDEVRALADVLGIILDDFRKNGNRSAESLTEVTISRASAKQRSSFLLRPIEHGAVKRIIQVSDRSQDSILRYLIRQADHNLLSQPPMPAPPPPRPQAATNG
jgi:hypothetical protein